MTKEVKCYDQNGLFFHARGEAGGSSLAKFNKIHQHLNSSTADISAPDCVKYTLHNSIHIKGEQGEFSYLLESGPTSDTSGIITPAGTGSNNQKKNCKLTAGKVTKIKHDGCGKDESCNAHYLKLP